MPDIAACPDGALPTIIDGCLYALQYLFCGSNLIRPHHQQLLIHIKHAVLGQYVQQRVLGKEGGSKIAQICQECILLIRPIGCKLKRITICLMLAWTTSILLLLGITCGVGVVFRFSTIRNHEHLHKIEHRFACPEGIALITVNLVKGLLDTHASALQFYLHHRQTIHQYGHVVAVLIGTVAHLILIGHLQTVVIDVVLVNQSDVALRTIIQEQCHYIAIALYHLRLVLNGHLLIRDHRQQAFPLRIAQCQLIQQPYLLPEVCQQISLVLYPGIFIALTLQLLNHRAFQLGLALIALSRLWLHLEVSHHRRVLLLYYDLIVIHKRNSFYCLSFYDSSLGGISLSSIMSSM